MGAVYLYGLVDPRTDLLRYVGKTYSPKQRLKQHLKDGRLRPNRCHRSGWVRSLLNAGVEPEMVILEEVAADAWRKAETFWIGYLRYIGCDLVNSTGGGRGLDSFTAESRARMSASHTGKPTGKAGRPAPLALWVPRLKDFILTAPDGTEHLVKHLAAFCQERGIARPNLFKVLRGDLNHSQGWRIRYADQPKPSEPFLMISPSGASEWTDDLTQWCLDRKMKVEHFRVVLSGRKNHYNGWRIRHVEEPRASRQGHRG